MIRKICAHPGCGRELWLENRIGLCRRHWHQTGCRCRNCIGKTKTQWRIRTREELVADGLLFEKPLFPLSL
ncbi:hypothetical protein ACFOMH_16485 [Paracoccus mangrovi]|uniref:Uncharacterized protein n=1 Tax=Paracoccus mangrovi TaxID=1715645 RepID=A0ABV7R6H4_9RHOB